MQNALLAIFTLITIPLWGALAGGILGLLIQNPVLWVVAIVALYFMRSSLK
jgi:uncharacterized membrane protein YoaK (UPF0700 family)